MSKWCAFVSLVALGASSCSGCGENGGGDELLECGDERGAFGGQSQAIVNGDASFDPEILQLSPGQILAVGAIMESYGSSWANICTGTLVAPDVVLTAAHCVTSGGSVTPASQMAFGIGADVSRGDIVRAAEIRVHPHYNYRTGRNDTALLVLETDAREVVSDIVPIPYNCLTLASGDLLGEWVQTVGYGCVDSYCRNDNTRRWWASERIVEVSEYDFTVDGFGEQGVCFGDSGGPTLWTMPTGEVRVIGTLHGGDSMCGNQDWYPSTFDSCEFLNWYATGCDEETELGRCEDDVLIYCDEGLVVTIDCSLHGEYCGDAGRGAFGCTEEPAPEPEPEPEPDSCEEAGWEGRCEGDTAVWCEDGKLMERRCDDCLQTCGWISEELGYYCR